MAKTSSKFRRNTLTTLLMLIGIGPNVGWSQSFARFGDPTHDPVREDEVLGVSVSQDLTYDSNVFRLPDNGSMPR